MTPEDRAAVIRECAEIVAHAPVVTNGRHVDGIATLSRAARRLLVEVGDVPRPALPDDRSVFATLQRNGLARPAKS